MQQKLNGKNGIEMMDVHYENIVRIRKKKQSKKKNLNDLIAGMDEQKLSPNFIGNCDL